MNEGRLKLLLRETPIPGGEAAERRGLEVMEQAFEQRRRPQRNALPRLALALAIAALLAALLLSPAGASVRDWVGDVFTGGMPDAEPGLTEIPGGGRLLVQAPAGPWVVQPDGSRRLLGNYGEATWSPRGLFVAAAAGRTLSAVEPNGTPRWSLSSEAAVSDPRWSPSGFQVAYRSGDQLRIVAADGSDDRLLDPSVGPVAPAWAPWGPGLIAYVDAGGRLRIARTDSGEDAGSAPASPGIANLEWAAGGSTLLESSPSSLRVRKLTVNKLATELEIGMAREIGLPASVTIREAALSPGGDTVAALLAPRSTGPPRSLVVLIDIRGGSPRRLLSTPGRLAELAWSPDASRLLISWPDADQWLFVPTDGRGRVRAIGEISGQFTPGRRGSVLPRIEGWCCPTTAGPAG
jgi:dipeptidyl aminopeptidase/acylaminoacyl peptidase